MNTVQIKTPQTFSLSDSQFSRIIEIYNTEIKDQNAKPLRRYMKEGQGFSIRDGNRFRELLITRSGLISPQWAYSADFNVEEKMWLFGALREVVGRDVRVVMKCNSNVCETVMS